MKKPTFFVFLLLQVSIASAQNSALAFLFFSTPRSSTESQASRCETLQPLFATDAIAKE
jgi:hypothetical protein